jgi:4-amino-4-deoxychorismate lyase
MLAALLNGQPVDPDQPAVYLNDRGWQYGDGLFETMLLKNGQVRFLADHLERLRNGCGRLAIALPPPELLRHELHTLCRTHQHAVVKLTLTRGRAERGYRPAAGAEPTRVWQLFAPLASVNQSGITARWCATRLSRNVLLAGIKHCNRLEQVLAQAEWSDTGIAEGLMLDTESELVCGTMSNVFLLLEGMLVTPDLRYSGVAGVMRKNILRLASLLMIETEQRAVRAEEIAVAQELFVSSAIRGIQPVMQLEHQTWRTGDITARLMNALQAC